MDEAGISLEVVASRHGKSSSTNLNSLCVCVWRGARGGELIAFRYHHNQKQQAKQQPILLATHQV
jgi:hypothetical protein